ncbi:MAG: homoserine dehydrogenase [Actinobacteria bacterium 13_1_20CM_3_68_9]|nr:MAG: homoserine dehydrogenase [Actinobacteria bacterium 13_1_20CM_3_68_9]
MTEPVRIGLLGRGTVGNAFHELLSQRADAIAAAAGRRPEITGVLRRAEGDFDAILEASEIVVELIGGTEPARDYVLRALRAGRHVVTANKQLIAQFGDELFEAARETGVQLRFEAAVAGAVPVIRVIQESLADALQRAQELGYAEADPSDDVGGADAAAKMAILARLSFGVPVSLADVSYEGITEIQPDDIAYAKELGLSLKLLGVAERRDGGISVRVFPCFLYPRHPLAPVEGAFNAVMVEAPTITEITLSGPGAGGVETASAVLGDVVSILSGRAPVHAARQSLEIVRDQSSSFYLHLEVADRPGVLARIADVLGRNEVSVRSVVQRGMGDDARLVMVMHECPESWFFKALDEMATLDFIRAQPRAIRVIEEEFV